MRQALLLLAVLCPSVLLPAAALGGGGPANVMVLYNGDDTDAAGVAGYYAQARSVPGGQLCALAGVDPTQRSMTFDDYETFIHEPFETCLDAMPQPDEIDYVVIVRGLPYRISIEDGFYTSLSAMLQVHRATLTSTEDQLAGTRQVYDPEGYYKASILNPEHIYGAIYGGDYEISNPYQSWYSAAPGIVRAAELPSSFKRLLAGDAGGYSFGGNLFIVTRLDGFDYEDAGDLVDRAVAGDASFPAAEILCMEGSDQPRAARDPECEFVVRHLNMADITATWLTPFDANLSGRTVAAYFTGTAGLRTAIAGNTYVSGAIACNLTSTGAAPSNFFCNDAGDVCPQSESQTSIARFIRAGATGAHGTVAEPLNNTFPNAGTLLLYTFGYNLGESFFFNQRYLYWQNLFIGDPLASPWAERPAVAIETDDGTIAQGSDLNVTATHSDGVAGVILYLDGVRVADSVGDSLAFTIDDAPGTEIDVLAVAIAANAVVSRPGWPNPDQQPQPDVQGWSTAAITVTEPLPEPDDAPDEAVEAIEPVDTVESAPDAIMDVPIDPAADSVDTVTELLSDVPAEDAGPDEPDDGGSGEGCGCSVAR